eukprot:5147364-Pleurochrysis_carterae.AAC.1
MRTNETGAPACLAPKGASLGARKARAGAKNRLRFVPKRHALRAQRAAFRAKKGSASRAPSRQNRGIRSVHALGSYEKTERWSLVEPTARSCGERIESWAADFVDRAWRCEDRSSLERAISACADEGKRKGRKRN